MAAMLLTAGFLNRGDDRQQKYEAAPAHGAQQQSYTPSPLTTQRENAGEPDWNKPECSSAKSHDEADLCQQRRMAKAAENTVTLNQIQVAIGIVGALFLMWNLYYARQAAFGAVEAAKAASETADAMMDAERPHMLATMITMKGLQNAPDDDGQVPFTVEYKFTNSGKTPALMRAHLIMIHAGENLPEQPNYREPERTRHTITVNGWWGSMAPGIIFFQADDVVRVLKGDASIWVYGIIEYADSFDRIHRTRFCYRMDFDGNSSERHQPDGPDSYWEYT